MSAFEAQRDAERWPAIVIGAGAAGMLCAIFAARRGARVLLLESRPKPGAKIRVSGGGRCNVLPSEVALEDFETSGSRTAMRNVLFSWPLQDVIRYFENDLGLKLKVEATGKIFPKSDSSKEVVGALLAECARSGATLRGASRVASITPLSSPASAGGFLVRGESGESWIAERIVIATGGLSLPKTGSDGAGYRFARAMGHTIRPTYPALVGLRTNDVSFAKLAGVSLPATLRIAVDGRIADTRTGDFLFTHHGFSGPVVLDASHWFTSAQDPAPRLLVKWGGSASPDWEALLRKGGAAQVGTMARDSFPRRLADHLLLHARVSPERKSAELTREERARLVQTFESFPLSISGSEGYAKAEVTGGGLPLEEVHLGNLESRAQPGLHFAGEIFDVTGRLGGYNFLWAWVTGRKAGLALSSERS